MVTKLQSSTSLNCLDEEIPDTVHNDAPPQEPTPLRLPDFPSQHFKLDNASNNLSSCSSSEPIFPKWWYEKYQSPLENADKGIVCTAGQTALLDLTVEGHSTEALLDTGASRSFINSSLVRTLGLQTFSLTTPCTFTLADGTSISLDCGVHSLTIRCGKAFFVGDFVVGPIPFGIILGIDWFLKNRVAWFFLPDSLRVFVWGHRMELPVRLCEPSTTYTSPEPFSRPEVVAAAAEDAYVPFAKQVSSMTPEEAFALLRLTPAQRRTFQRAASNPSSTTLPSSLALANSFDDDCESTWATATLDYTLFDSWVESDEALSLPPSVLRVLKAHRSLFPDNLPPGLPPKRPFDHRILTLPGKLPAKAPLYKMSLEELGHHKKELDRLLKNDWIGPTYSPICAPSLMVDKHDDGSGERKMRMVVNYKALNALTIAPDYPLPSIQYVLELLGGSKYFTTLDLDSGFHQIRLAPEDRWKTAFRSVFGLFEYRVMPFGLKGAPATFQANITAYLQPYLGQGVIAYLDDVLIYSPDLDTHVEILNNVLDIFAKHQFFPKLTKCKFAVQELEYLGYTVGADGVKPSPSKVAAIESWPEELSNDTQVRQFLGTVNYCRMFMGPSFADIARPLVRLTKKGVPFRWEEEHTSAVRKLKERLIHYTVLQMPNPKRPYELYTDASGYAVGAVLEQDGKPVGFHSQVMTPVQQRYSIYDQELLALIVALEKWKHLLRSASVIAYTDHQALMYLQRLDSTKPLRGRTARWLDFLAEFQDLTITYVDATKNQVADALSRHPSIAPSFDPSSTTPPPTYTSCTIVSTDILMSISSSRHTRSRSRDTQPVDDRSTPLSPDPRFPESWLAAYPRCPVFREVFKAAAQRPGESITLELNNVLYSFRFSAPYLHICVHGLWRICVPTLPEFLSLVLYRHHDHVTAGHRGQKKTYMAVSRYYFWPGMRTYTNAYVESCVQCRASKSISQKPAGLLQPLAIPPRRWSHVSLDFITDLPTTQDGFDSILVIVDSLSKMAHFIPTKKAATADDTARLLADRLIRYHGIPQVLISDRDPRFQSELWQRLCAAFQIKRALSSSYHPQSDGQTERVNRTLEQMLRTYIQADERQWERLLPALELAYNTTTHSSTELSPFEVMIGQNPITPADLDIIGELQPLPVPRMTKIFTQLCDRATGHLLRAKWRQKWFADRHRREVTYKPGDLVWVNATHLPSYSSCSKLEPRYRGPFPIEERVGSVAYRLTLPSSYQCHNVFHVSQLVPDRPRDPSMTSKEAEIGWQPLQRDNEGPSDRYEVDYILAQRGTGRNLQYLVKWRGFPEDQSTWEPAANLDQCPAIIRSWRRTLGKQRRSASSPHAPSTSSHPR